LPQHTYARPLPEQEIIRAIQKGNKEAFQQVFDTCYEKLCQYAFTLLKDMDEAEDTVQSIFLKLWEKRESLDIRHSVRPYLYKSVYHQCINQLEHRVIKLKHQEFGQREMSSATQPPEVFPDELEGNIMTAIDKLPQQCRTVFMLSRYETLKYADIARKLNISVNTVENQISKALRILRSELKDIFV
jgi:RNA polymerase sigma-70 factor (ECF subfamily)